MRGRKSRDYDVGHGKPPQNTQFKKGHSGNITGRPRGSRNASTLLDETLQERVIVSENGRRRSLTKLEATLKQLVNKAAQGDHRAMQLLLAHQIPRIEEHQASRSAIAERSPLPPPLSPEEKHKRKFEIATILQKVGYLTPQVADGDESDSDTPPNKKD
jgi:Family of unknown function (DUF5681)